MSGTATGVAFTADQLAAIDVTRRHEDACVVAGPGSGKTTVLVEYFSRLLDAGVDPLRILAITFTEKAAANMRAKLAEKLAVEPQVRGKLERAWVSTVHGFCGRLLRENAVFAGVDPEFTIADERDAVRLQQEAIAGAVEELFIERPDAVRALIRGLESYEFEGALLSAYDAMRGAGLNIEEVALMSAPGDDIMPRIAAALAELPHTAPFDWKLSQREQFDAARQGARRLLDAANPLEALQAIEAFDVNLIKCKRGNAVYDRLKQLKEDVVASERLWITEVYAAERLLLIDIIRRFDRLYRERKRQAGLLDFADLEEYSVRLLSVHPEARARLQAQFDHILMDEFQDTNGQQAKLLSLVRAPGRFYAVGDINQSIFGFRHAEPEVFTNYRDEVARGGRRSVELAANFRSRAGILRAVETITSGQPGIEQRPLVPGRVFDEPREECVEVIGVTAADASQALEWEAQWVARRILDLLAHEPRFRFEDVAVLVRNTEVLGSFCEAFDRAGVPYLVNRGRGFYENREVTDLIHLLRVIANPRDEISLAAVLRSPLVEVSDEALLRLRMAADNLADALGRLTEENAVSFLNHDFQKLTTFRARLAEWRARREQVSFDRLLAGAIDDCGYRPESGERGAANIDKFLAQARQASSRVTLDRFVQELAAVRSSNPRETDAPPEEATGAVQVMTVHAAKGLEFPNVFVAALHKGIDTAPPAVAFSPRLGLGAQWRNPVTGKSKNDVYRRAIADELDRREAEEANRLLYVAMTRAEEHLVLSFSGALGKQPPNWAETVKHKLGLDLTHEQEVTLDQASPAGLPWKLGVLTASHAPELPQRAAEMREAPDETLWLPPPAVTEQQDSNATVSDLKEFAACPRRYYLGRYLGFHGRLNGSQESAGEGDEDDEDDELSATGLGTEVHRLLAGAPVPDPDPESIRLAEVFRRGALGRRLAKAVRSEKEFDFLMAMGDLVVRGQVDLWFEESGELVIVDYKTDDVSAHKAHQRAQEYAPQLRLYAMAVERIVGRPPDQAWLHFLRPDTLVKVDLTPSLLESPEQLSRELEEAQESLNFPLREAEHCHRCPFFRGLCPAK